MTRRLRHAVVLLVLPLAVVLGLASPARADFTARVSTPSATISTVTVAPPTKLSTAGSTCDADGNLLLKLSWTKSATARISSYQIRTYTLFGAINYPIGSVGAGTSAISTQLGSNFLGYAFTVTTTTDYGWTAESAQTGTLRC